MTATLYTLHRHRDVSTVSGTGAVATICEFSSGLVAMHWDSPTPSVAVYTDIRHIEALHGHSGASVLEIHEPARLLKAYARIMPYLLNDLRIPAAVGPHPEHPDRLLVTFKHEPIWRFWISLLEGSTHAAVHEDTADETEHRWVSADGNLWLVYHTRHTTEHPLTTFDREDRG